MALKLYGASWSPDSDRVKKFLGEHKVHYDWLDIDTDEDAARKVVDVSNGKKVIPVLIMEDGSVLIAPSDEELMKKLNLPPDPELEFTDLAIIGAGPAGMAAAIYTTREDIGTILYDKGVVGGWASLTDKIDNYPGFPDGIGGLELASDMEKQARRFGADFRLGVEVKGLKRQGRYIVLDTNEGEKLARAVIVATGSDYRRLNIPGEAEYTSRGVHYCATCDGPFYRNKKIIVIGGGNAAMQESMFLTKFSSDITMLVRGSELKGSEILIDNLKLKPEIKVEYNTVVTEIIGQDGLVSSVKAGNTVTGQERVIDTNGVFVFIGLLPNTGWLKGVIDLDEIGMIKTDKTLETSMKGVFAAGDVRSGASMQIASATGEGATAALMVREYLKEVG